jgi:hypothetical protein
MMIKMIDDRIRTMELATDPLESASHILVLATPAHELFIESTDAAHRFSRCREVAAPADDVGSATREGIIGLLEGPRRRPLVFGPDMGLKPRLVYRTIPEALRGCQGYPAPQADQDIVQPVTPVVLPDEAPLGHGITVTDDSPVPLAMPKAQVTGRGQPEIRGSRLEVVILDPDQACVLRVYERPTDEILSPAATAVVDDDELPGARRAPLTGEPGKSLEQALVILERSQEDRAK